MKGVREIRIFGDISEIPESNLADFVSTKLYEITFKAFDVRKGKICNNLLKNPFKWSRNFKTGAKNVIKIVINEM